MARPINTMRGMLLMAVLLAAGAAMGAAAGQNAIDKKEAKKVALEDAEVKQLILLMDTDKNGKISKKEFMTYMEAEFDRLDADKSGELDPNELRKSNLRPSRFAGR